jgi:hypothetical protein
VSTWDNMKAVADGVDAQLATALTELNQKQAELGTANAEVARLTAEVLRLQGIIDARTEPKLRWGPIGSVHARTPLAFAHTVEVPATWLDIQSALASITPAQADAGARVLVRPGTLPGFGAASGSTPVLSAIARRSTKYNIVVAPRDGWGTVAVAGAHRMAGVKGVTFLRINADYVRFTDSSYSVWSQSKVSLGGMIVASGENVEYCDFHEVVMPHVRTDSANDPFGYAAGDGVWINHSTWSNMYIAPVFRPTGNSNHLDTIQMYGTGAYRGLHIKDSVIWGSQNCSLQLGGTGAGDPNAGTPFLTVTNSYVASQRDWVDAGIGAVPAGAYVPLGRQVINGNGEPGQLHFRDSVVIGTIYTNTTTKYGNVVGTVTSDTTPPPVTSGAWLVDANLMQNTPIPPSPSDAYLASIWK